MHLRKDHFPTSERVSVILEAMAHSKFLKRTIVMPTRLIFMVSIIIVPPNVFDLFLFDVDTDSRKNHSNGGANDMTRDMEETVDLIRGPTTRVMAKKIEEEHKGNVALFGKSFQDLTLYPMEGEYKNRRGNKILLISKMQVKEPKEARMEDLDGSIIKWKGNEGLPLEVGDPLPEKVTFYSKRDKRTTTHHLR